MVDFYLTNNDELAAVVGVNGGRRLGENGDDGGKHAQNVEFIAGC